MLADATPIPTAAAASTPPATAMGKMCLALRLWTVPFACVSDLSDCQIMRNLPLRVDSESHIIDHPPTVKMMTVQTPSVMDVVSEVRERTLRR
jgi:hypothetical protein